MWKNVLSCALLAEAAFLAWKYRKEQDRLTVTVGYFVLAAVLTALNIAEIAAGLAGVDFSIFSRELTRRLGTEALQSCEKAMPISIQRALAFSTLDSIILSIVLISSVMSGGAVTLMASISYAGINTISSILNASLFSLQVFRFIGQVYIVVADLGDFLYPFFTATGGVFLVSRATRRFGATLVALGVGFGLLMPLVLNCIAIAADPKPVKGAAKEIGILKFEVELTIPVASLDASIKVKELSVKAPPGFIVIYRSPSGRVVVRPAGVPYMEYVDQYEVTGLYYSGMSLPFEGITFQVKPCNLFNKFSAQTVGTGEGALRWDSFCSSSRDCTIVRIKVGKGIVAFSDNAQLNDTPPKGWGVWIGRGFFLYEGSEKYGQPLPWYSIGGYLLNHKVVGIADPRMGLVSTLQGNVALDKFSPISGEESAYSLNVTVTDVIVWIEGDIDANGVCWDGIPTIIDAGESEIAVNGSKLKVTPAFSCEVGQKYSIFPDSRIEAIKWFDQYARMLNASLPVSTVNTETSRCLYGDQSEIQALLWNKHLLFSQGLWPKTGVTSVAIKVSYFGNVTRPAIIGPITAGSSALTFTVFLPLVSGVGACEPELVIANFTVINEAVVSGLLYDTLLEDVIQPSYVNLIKEEILDIINGVALLALIASALAASLIGVDMLSWVFGGTAIKGVVPLIPLNKSLHLLEGLGRAVLGFTELLISARRDKGLSRIAVGPHLYELYDLRKRLEDNMRTLNELHRAILTNIDSSPKGRITHVGISVLGFMWRHRQSYPLPFALYTAGELLRRAAFKVVSPLLRGEERLFAVLLHPVGSKLLAASDVLYAVAWVLNMKPFTTPLSSKFIKRTLQEVKLVSKIPVRVNLLNKGSYKGVDSLKAYSDRVSKAVLQGGRPKPKDIKGFFRALATVTVPPQVMRIAWTTEPNKLEVEELAWRVALVTCATCNASTLTLRLLSEKPEIALRVADSASLGIFRPDDEVKTALFSGLSKINVDEKLLETLGTGFSLAVTWLASLEREESWRYLALRLVQEAVEGHKPWFVSELPPGAEKLLKSFGTPLDRAKQCDQSYDVIETLQRFINDAHELYLSREELKIIEGFWKAFEEAGVDAEKAVEFYVLSGDPYWLGYASAKVSKEGGGRWIIEQIFHLSLDKPFDEVRSVFGHFIAKACREGVAAAKNLEEVMRFLNSYGILPQPWHSPALWDYERRETMKVYKTVEEAIRVSREVEEKVRAIRIEAYEYRSKLLFRDLYDMVEIIQALDAELLSLCDNARKLRELGENLLRELQRKSA